VTNFPLNFELQDYDNDYLTVEQIENMTAEKIVSAFKKKITLQMQKIEEAKSRIKSSQEIIPSNIIFEIICNILIRSIDRLWQEHLLNIDHLRTEVNLRSIGNKDPLLEFKHEAFHLFADLSQKMKIDIAHSLFKFEMVLPEPEPRKLKLADVKKQKKEPVPAMPLIDLSLMD
jgi:preprotein translocase subunit SecA